MIRVFLGRAKFKSAPETFHVVVHLDELIVQSGVGDRCEMKNRVESCGCRITELFSPIECRKIFGDEISTIPCQILEITGSEIIDHREVRVREFFLQRQCEIRADESGTAGDDELRLGCGHRIFVIPSEVEESRGSTDR